MLNRFFALVGLICLLWTGVLLVDATAAAQRPANDLQLLADANAEAKLQFSAHDPDVLGRFKAKRQLQRVLRHRWGGEVEYAMDRAELTALIDKYPRVLGLLDGWLLVRAPQSPVPPAERRIKGMVELGLYPPFLAFGILALLLAVVLPHGFPKRRAASLAAAEQFPPHPELEAHLARLNSLAAAHAASDELADRVREKTDELRELLQSAPGEATQDAAGLGAARHLSVLAPVKQS